MTTGEEYTSVLNWAPSSQRSAIIEHLEGRPGSYDVVGGAGVRDMASMFAHFGDTIFRSGPVANWAHFEDLLHQLVARSGPEYALVWQDADHMLEGAVPVLVDVGDVFFRKARAARGWGGRFRVFFLGEGPNFTGGP